ncbi:hypothetical protein LCGC14_1210560 [marine sediment metagenome]|uniref:Uncharacterized protein n=1 Tax=marine sediment metagenome TaxID=412755 RepID=A0A0F9NWH8_9ZZZZ
MVISLTAQEKVELQQAGSLMRPLEGASGVQSAIFHNPKTGQEFVNLPVDPYHLGRHLRRGLVMGPASPELREKWESGESDRQADNDSLMAEHLSKAPAPIEDTPRFEEAVASAAEVAVNRILEKLGVELPNDEKRQAHPQEEGEVTEVDHQTDFFKTIDASAESETKLNVSPASRPNLRLVE